MARRAKIISQGNSALEHLSVGVLALCYPLQKIQSLINECGKQSMRTRDLPPALMVYYVITLSLFPGVAYQSVLRWLISGLQWLEIKSQFRVACRESLSNARQRLGELPLRRLHEEMAKPMNSKALKGSHFKDLLMVAFDGSTLALQDTKANSEAFGRSTNQNGDGAWPLARFVALVECGTHLIFAAHIGGYKDSEITLAKHLMSQLKPGMLCLADRLFPSYELWQQARATGAELLWRARMALPLRKIKTLSDGSYLAEWLPEEARLKGKQAIVVRVIEYRLNEKGAKSQSTEVYRLITTLLDPEVAPAGELAAVYPQRWEIELTIKESKTILRKGRITLRSKNPELVRQEFWGLLLAHYLVRKMMAQASLENGLDPDVLSYEGCIEIIKSTQTGSVLSFPPSSQNKSI